LRAALLALTLSLTASIATPALADFYVGFAAYQRGDYETAFREFREVAEQGHTEAQYALGWMYYWGEGVQQDYGDARRWFRISADQGHVFGQLNLGLMYYNGDGILKDFIESSKWFDLVANNEKAISQDYIEAYKRFAIDAEKTGEHNKASKARDNLKNMMAQYKIAQARVNFIKSWITPIKPNFISPLLSLYITDRFCIESWRCSRRHTGIDLRASVGTPVFSVADGCVYSVGSESGYGKIVRVEHANGYKTGYAHLSKIFVKKRSA